MKGPEEELSEMSVQVSRDRRGSATSSKPDKKDKKEKKDKDADGNALTPKKEKKLKGTGTGRAKKQASSQNVQAPADQADGFVEYFSPHFSVLNFSKTRKFL